MHTEVGEQFRRSVIRRWLMPKNRSNELPFLFKPSRQVPYGLLEISGSLSGNSGLIRTSHCIIRRETALQRSIQHLTELMLWSFPVAKQSIASILRLM